MIVSASAPSNIALIKYMGKVPNQGNHPTNSSLSFTLSHLKSFVEIHQTDAPNDSWAALIGEGFQPMSLSPSGVDRFLQHFQALKKHWGLQGHYLVRSGNNFPSDCGLASSASSFAALTLATYELAKTQKLSAEESRADLAELSRQGSGSSCRSFFGPFCLWYREGVKPLEFAGSRWIHDVVVLEAGKKEVSSSSAHQRVISSLNFHGRPERAERRLAETIQALKSQSWKDLFELMWAEFWDMHSLFETAKPAFGYMSSGTMEILGITRDFWRKNGDGPLVTMDAGPNVHLMWRENQVSLRATFLDGFGKELKIYSSLGEQE